MADTQDNRAVRLARYMIAENATVRRAAQHFHISKSTVHKDLQQRLPQYSRILYEQVRIVLERNKAERHIRGGMATKAKYNGQNRVE